MWLDLYFQLLLKLFLQFNFVLKLFRFLLFTIRRCVWQVRAARKKTAWPFGRFYCRTKIGFLSLFWPNWSKKFNTILKLLKNIFSLLTFFGCKFVPFGFWLFEDSAWQPCDESFFLLESWNYFFCSKRRLTGAASYVILINPSQ